MKVSQNWLKELVDINTTPEQLSEKLSIGGFEVESLVDTSLKFKGVVLGKVLSAEKHNNSDKLTICKVDVGFDKLQIICATIATSVSIIARSSCLTFSALAGLAVSVIDVLQRCRLPRRVRCSASPCGGRAWPHDKMAAEALEPATIARVQQLVTAIVGCRRVVGGGRAAGCCCRAGRHTASGRRPAARSSSSPKRARFRSASAWR